MNTDAGKMSGRKVKGTSARGRKSGLPLCNEYTMDWGFSVLAKL